MASRSRVPGSRHPAAVGGRAGVGVAWLGSIPAGPRESSREPRPRTLSRRIGIIVDCACTLGISPCAFRARRRRTPHSLCIFLCVCRVGRNARCHIRGIATYAFRAGKRRCHRILGIALASERARRFGSLHNRGSLAFACRADNASSPPRAREARQRSPWLLSSFGPGGLSGAFFQPKR